VEISCNSFHKSLHITLIDKRSDSKVPQSCLASCLAQHPVLLILSCSSFPARPVLSCWDCPVLLVLLCHDGACPVLLGFSCSAWLVLSCSSTCPGIKSMFLHGRSGVIFRLKLVATAEDESARAEATSGILLYGTKFLKELVMTWL
jgi:hypothetical protein